jgi:hypothetical protein
MIELSANPNCETEGSLSGPYSIEYTIYVKKFSPHPWVYFKAGPHLLSVTYLFVQVEAKHFRRLHEKTAPG